VKNRAGRLPDVLGTLFDRFDASALDIASRATRIRLSINGHGDSDLFIQHRRAEIQRTDSRRVADGRLSADRAVWRRASVPERLVVVPDHDCEETAVERVKIHCRSPLVTLRCRP
jgi:hypothetical protein